VEELEEYGRFFTMNSTLLKGGGAKKWHFDLKGYIAQKLANTRVSRIETLGNDTYAEEDRFFSFRRGTQRGEKDYGRQVSCIMLE
jgi:copper oxidase (laccase) domain-containing protein